MVTKEQVLVTLLFLLYATLAYQKIASPASAFHRRPAVEKAYVLESCQSMGRQRSARRVEQRQLLRRQNAYYGVRQ